MTYIYSFKQNINTMKLLNYFLFAVCLCFALVSCEKETPQPSEGEQLPQLIQDLQGEWVQKWVVPYNTSDTTTTNSCFQFTNTIFAACNADTTNEAVTRMTIENSDIILTSEAGFITKMEVLELTDTTLYYLFHIEGPKEYALIERL